MPELLGFKAAQAARQAGGQRAGSNTAQRSERPGESGREVRGMRGVAVKCIDITQNSDCEGSAPAPY